MSSVCGIAALQHRGRQRINGVCRADRASASASAYRACRVKQFFDSGRRACDARDQEQQSALRRGRKLLGVCRDAGTALQSQQRQLPDEGLRIFQAAQVEAQGAVFDVADDRYRHPAKRRRNTLQFGALAPPGRHDRDAVAGTERSNRPPPQIARKSLGTGHVNQSLRVSDLRGPVGYGNAAGLFCGTCALRLVS